MAPPWVSRGLRTGLRFGNEGRALRADEYGRLFDRQTFGIGVQLRIE